ncbi:MAG: (deoxy)nucleoside triphosphate pyrophosphohydrolase [Clostridia bacterium]|nr:(deoxy)nucleoside triphosphate pyrophosphohydrolase [Clostridia bacterium]
MQEIHVVGAAIRDGKKLLAAQRSEKMKMPLKWEFAGGKVESGETHRQALEREIFEELGVAIKVGKFIADGYSKVGDKTIILHVYEASILEGVPRAAEHAQLKWIDIVEIPELDWAEPDIPACKEIIKIYGD